MKPDYDKAVAKANETFMKYGSIGALRILKSFPNVRVFSFEGFNIDAFTCVRRKESLQYIILYNSGISSYLLEKALARELGHIVLEHDGNSPEDIYAEEAECFAYHFITQNAKVKYRPVRVSLSWEFKDMQLFDNIESLKGFIADEQNKFSKFIGKKRHFAPEDVELQNPVDYNTITGWKNCYDIVLDGKTIGYCGE